MKFIGLLPLPGEQRTDRLRKKEGPLHEVTISRRGTPPHPFPADDD